MKREKNERNNKKKKKKIWKNQGKIIFKIRYEPEYVFNVNG